MVYKIAVATSDGLRTDWHFGAALRFLIYEVSEEGNWKLEDIREKTVEQEKETESEGCKSNCQQTCRQQSCEGSGDEMGVLELIADCRCVICRKTGFRVQKQLERKSIVSFDYEGDVDHALKKVTAYFYRVDHHQSLRGIVNHK